MTENSILYLILYLVGGILFLLYIMGSLMGQKKWDMTIFREELATLYPKDILYMLVVYPIWIIPCIVVMGIAIMTHLRNRRRDRDDGL